MKFQVESFVAATSAQIVFRGNLPREGFESVETDSRSPNLKGNAFIALVGEKFDGHQFVKSAAEAGASVLVVHKDVAIPEKFEGLVLKVPDTLMALQKFASRVRSQLHECRVIGLTGSNGKTTTKLYLQTLLGGSEVAYASPGSFNNHWGVPISILANPHTSKYLILEMGMNHAGEIADLVQMAAPDCVGVTMVGRAHIENFLTVDRIAEAKAEIYSQHPGSLESSAVFGVDQPWTTKMLSDYQKRFKSVTTFSAFGAAADVSLKLFTGRLSEETIAVEGVIGGQSGFAQTQILGDHNITNLAAAAAFAFSLGEEPRAIWRRMSQVQGEWGRLQMLRAKQEKQSILFDGYNANPDSMTAFLKVVSQLKRKHGKSDRLYLVLSEMRELGEQSSWEHESLGQQVAAVEPDFVVFVGASYVSFGSGLNSQANLGRIQFIAVPSLSVEEFDEIRRSRMNDSGLIAVKGSRGGGLEKYFVGEVPAKEH